MVEVTPMVVVMVAVEDMVGNSHMATAPQTLALQEADTVVAPQDKVVVATMMTGQSLLVILASIAESPTSATSLERKDLILQESECYKIKTENSRELHLLNLTTKTMQTEHADSMASQWVVLTEDSELILPPINLQVVDTNLYTLINFIIL